MLEYAEADDIDPEAIRGMYQTFAAKPEIAVAAAAGCRC